MIELKGKYNTAKVFTDNIESSAIRQITALLNQKSIECSTVRIMPDVHSGAGCVIGTTMTITDKVIPNLVGVDIGCGMLTIKLKEKRIDLPNLDSLIRKYVPSGINFEKANSTGALRDKAHSKTSELRINDLALIGKRGAKVKLQKALLSCGTLGSGNHFIEVDKASDGTLYLVIHTGSRHLGIEVASYYQQKAYDEYIIQDYDKEYKRLLEATPEKDRSKVLNELIKHKKQWLRTDVPYELAYCEGELFNDYIHDMEIAQEFASMNRRIIADTILKYAKLHEEESFETVHNYIDTKNMILRKGSVSAQAGEKLLIPMNMRDGSLICLGKGNPDWNYSAPHGAGRLMSRSEAKQRVGMTEFKESMQGIYTTCVNKSTIDESPMAYKPMEEIINNIGDTVEILEVIRPIYNFKAGEEK